MFAKLLGLRARDAAALLWGERLQAEKAVVAVVAVEEGEGSVRRYICL